MKILAILALLGLSGNAQASQPTFEVGYSSHAATGIDCTSGTVVQLNASRPTGFSANIAGYRVQNQDSSYSVWLGGVSVSTSAATNRGEELKPGSSSVWMIYKDYARAAAIVPLYCRGADGIGTGVAKLSVVWFGY